MIEKALRYLMEKRSPVELQNVNGRVYSDRPLTLINGIPHADPITLSTLSSLTEYIKSNFDERARIFVHVESPTVVSVFSCLDEDRNREKMVIVKANVPYFPYDQFISHEDFCIKLQTKFLASEDRALLLKFAGTVESGSVSEYGDDGVTQKATVKTGIASKCDAVVPNPVVLAGRRTFVEVEQPYTQYVFRMKQTNNGITCALFDADGGAWEIAAMENIKKYLKKELDGIEGLVVIS